MKRRDLIQGALVAGALTGSGIGALAEQPAQRQHAAQFTRQGEIVVERAAQGRPYTGRVLAAIQPHADDLSIFAGGTVAKLINEGYTGVLIRTTNDEMTGAGTRGEGVLHNEQDNSAVAAALGLKKTYDLEYRNHRLDAVSPQDFRGRMIFLIRLLRIDTVICYDHWGLYEENPDHYVTAAVVESACWMAGDDKDYPEHFDAGLKPHAVTEKYYFARGPQIANRIVDISGTVGQKIEAIRRNVTQGPGGEAGARFKAQLAARHLRLPELGNDDEAANRNYIERFVLDYDSLFQRGVPSDKEIGARYGLQWAERFRYVSAPTSRMEDYISKHAVAL